MKGKQKRLGEHEVEIVRDEEGRLTYTEVITVNEQGGGVVALLEDIELLPRSALLLGETPN